MQRFGLTLASLLLAGSVYGQTPDATLIVESTGMVRAEHQTAHSRNGQSVHWDLGTGAKSWYVIFTGKSPCAGGAKEFGSEAGLAKACSIANARPGTYKYSSSDHRRGKKHDPVIIVDQ